MSHSPRISWAALVGLGLTVLLAAPPGACLAAKASGGPLKADDIRLDPGPREMSAAERATSADPAHDIEHGVVLEHEVAIVEQKMPARFIFRMRAKVLSPEALDLADVVVPLGAPGVELVRFWAFAILPDGTVSELHREDLEEQLELEVRRLEARTLRGTIPRVVPGSVIEIGWEVEQFFLMGEPIQIADRWPVAHFHCVWLPWGNAFPAYTFLGRTRAKVEIDADHGALVVDAHGIEPLPDEPYAPALARRALRLVPYYRSDSTDDPDLYWKHRASARRDFLKEFARGRKEIDRAIAAMKLPAQAPLEDKLRLAYEWIQKNVENTNWRSWERREEVGEDEKDVRDGARWVLKERRGTRWQVRWTYASIARRLGAKVSLLYVVDRTEGDFNPAWMSMDQFGAAIILMEIPGAGGVKHVAVDPGYPLPFGEIPWWFAGTRGVVFSGSEYAGGRLDPLQADRSVMAVTVHLKPDLEEEILAADWSRQGGGQFRLMRSGLRRSRPKRREERLRRDCGESDTIEVLEATAPELEDPLAPYRLHCRTEQLLEPIDETVSEWAVPLAGPWLDTAPDVGLPPRRTPVSFAFPVRRTLALTIDAPAGFVPRAPPEPVSFETEFGRYRLACEVAGRSLRCERERTLEQTEIPPAKFGALSEFLARIDEADRLVLRFDRVKENP